MLGGGCGLFYAWWMFWASEGAKAMLEETSAPVVGVLLSAASWVKDAVQALVARLTGAALPLQERKLMEGAVESVKLFTRDCPCDTAQSRQFGCV